MPIVTQILSTLPGLSFAQRRFFLHLLSLWPCISGRFNLLNLSRYSPLCHRTFRRHFARAFPWGACNAALVQKAVSAHHALMLAQDASFVPKSGHHTPGLGRFYNSCSQRVERGLELSLVAVVDLTQNTAYALHAQQTKADTKADTKKECKDLRHLKATKAHWPSAVSHLAVDGAYARRPFVDGVTQEGLFVVSRLRADANVRYLFSGQQSGRGRPKRFDGKVHWNDLDLSRWHDEGTLEPGAHFFSTTLNHLSLKRDVKVALLVVRPNKTRSKATPKIRRVLLFSTDLTLSGREIVRLYRARFQIEFLFRGCPLGRAKSGAGLTHCQSRNTTTLENHWNAAFTALTLAKLSTPKPSQTTSFSWASRCQQHRNRHLLHHFSCMLGLDWNCIKSHPSFQSLLNYGVIAP